MPSNLSVGQVAAILNVAIIIVQLTYPLLLTFISVGVRTKTTNAATWSVFGRLINSSLWPGILRTDVSSSKNVAKRFRFLTFLANLATLLVALAAAITPLGLHTATRLPAAKNVPFSYARDASPIGSSTVARSGYKSNRLCGGLVIYDNCPGNNNGLNITDLRNGTWHVTNETGFPKPYISTAFAPNISAAFGRDAGADSLPVTVASLFDIEYRSFVIGGNKTEPGPTEQGFWIDKGEPRSRGRFEYYQQFLLNSKIEAVEGVIVSTGDSPGIGFRNHTLPPVSEHGYVWTEHILWLEPETVCIDLNVTLDYTLSVTDPFSTSDTQIFLTDRGGLVNHPAEYPNLQLETTTSNARLFEKAYTGAWLTNDILKGFLNATEKTLSLGKTYKGTEIGPNCQYVHPQPNSLAVGTYGSANRFVDFWSPFLPGVLFTCTAASSNATAPEDLPTSVFNVVNNFTFVYSQEPSRLALAAGLVQGVAIPIDAKGKRLPFNFDQSNFGQTTRWTQPYFSCASSVKASVKKMEFSIKGSPLLENLQIDFAQPEDGAKYTWAVEDVGWPFTDLGNPLWGVIPSEKAGKAGTATTFEQQSLPAGMASLFSYDGTSLMTEDAIAGATAPLGALSVLYSGSAYGAGGSIASSGFASSPDYSGTSDWSMLLEWSRLCRNASSVSRIFDLVWTDVMANAVVGTRGALSGSTSATVLRPAAEYRTTVTYDWRYGIVALCFVAFYLLMLLITLVMYVFKRCNIKMLRFFLNQTAAGRSVTTERFQGMDEVDFAKTKHWADKRGDEIVRVGNSDYDSGSNSTNGEKSRFLSEARVSQPG